jgi:hypothetical protein
VREELRCKQDASLGIALLSETRLWKNWPIALDFEFWEIEALARQVRLDAL